MTQTNIKFPEMRAEMLNYLKLVGNLNQDQENPSATEDLDYIVHYFFDDTEVAKKTEEYMGVTLISKEEVSAIGRFGYFLNRYLEKICPESSPLRFEEGAEWKAVQSAARQALDILEN